MIEKGRHSKPKIEKYRRYCPFCPSHVEDEHHFLIKCPIYSHLRDELFAEIIITKPDFFYTKDENLFRFLLKCQDIAHCTAHFVSQANSLRTYLLSKFKNMW